MDVMTPDEGLGWVDAQQHRDPRFADTEMTIRRAAIELQDKLSQGGTVDMVVHVDVIGAGPGYSSFRTVYFRSQIHRCGGVEELLLIEEQLRRAMRDVRTEVAR